MYNTVTNTMNDNIEDGNIPNNNNIRTKHYDNIYGLPNLADIAIYTKFIIASICAILLLSQILYISTNTDIFTDNFSEYRCFVFINAIYFGITSAYKVHTREYGLSSAIHLVSSFILLIWGWIMASNESIISWDILRDEHKDTTNFALAYMIFFTVYVIIV
jgi:hypothetical protein